jgi:cytoskeleton protein RodZ
MNNQQDNQIPDIKTVPTQAVSLGSTLRVAREQLGLSVNDVANRIKFAPRQIEWLEADDYVRLPEAAFVRGFVRSYARLVGLDPSGLLNGLPSSHSQSATAATTRSVEVAMPSGSSARRHNIIWLAAALVIALSLAIFERMHDRSPEKAQSVAKTTIQPLELPVAGVEGEPVPAEGQAPLSEATLQPSVPLQQVAPAPQAAVIKKSVRTAPLPTPVVTPTPVPAPAPVVAATPKHQKPVTPKPGNAATSPFPKQNIAQPPAATVMTPVENTAVTHSPEEKAKEKNEVVAGEHALRLEMSEPAWVEIKDGNGKVIISKMHAAGSLVRVAGKSPLDVTIGNAKAVRLFDNGKKINLARYTTAEVAHIKLK